MSDRLDRIEAALEALASEVAELTASVAATDEQVRTLVRLHADSRADIDRLYAAWPEHLRHPRPNGHGGEG